MILRYLADETTAPVVTGPTAEGWTIMILALGMVVSLAAFCFYRILIEPGAEERHHTPLDVDVQQRGPTNHD